MISVMRAGALGSPKLSTRSPFALRQPAALATPPWSVPGGWLQPLFCPLRSYPPLAECWARRGSSWWVPNKAVPPVTDSGSPPTQVFCWFAKPATERDPPGRSGKAFVDGRPERCRVEWLLDDGVLDAVQERPRPGRDRSAGYEHDPSGLLPIELAKLFVEIHARQVRHHQIAEDHVETLS